MFERISLKGKLLLITNLLALTLLLVGGLGVYTVRNVSSKYQHISSVNLPNIISMGRMRISANQANIAILALNLPGNSKEEVESAKSMVNRALESYQNSDKDYNEVPFQEGEGEIYNVQKEAWKNFSAMIQKIVELSNTNNPEDKAKLSELLHKDFLKVRSDYFGKLEKLFKYHEKDAADSVTKAISAANSGNILAISVALFGFIAAVSVGFLFSNVLSKTLSEIAASLSGGADQVAATAENVSSASEELSSAATEQASSLQETASSIEQMNATVTKNASSAVRSSELAQNGSQNAQKGKEVVGNMIQVIDEINQSNVEIMRQIEASNHEISNIVKVISEIGNKTKVINDIVFQTKLLSFNASVEAARAGEHGKGFAVVAEEVGNLAQMSGNAAKEISAMLEGSIQKVENIVTDTKTKVERLIENGKQKVESGASVAKRCGEVLDEIVRSILELNTMATEISASSQEQAQGVQEITRAMGQLDQVTQQNASASGQVASAAEEMAAQAGILRNMVQRLMNTIRGSGKVNKVVVDGKSSGDRIYSKPVNTPKLGTKTIAGASNVVALDLQKASPRAAEKFKNAVGGGVIPVESDSRFEDI